MAAVVVAWYIKNEEVVHLISKQKILDRPPHIIQHTPGSPCNPADDKVNDQQSV